MHVNDCKLQPYFMDSTCQFLLFWLVDFDAGAFALSCVAS